MVAITAKAVRTVIGGIFTAIISLFQAAYGVSLDGEYDFVIQGSNTIGARLAPELVKHFLEEKGGQDLRISRRDTKNEMTVSARINHQIIRVGIAAHGSSTGFRALLAGQTDIAAASRPVKDKEVNALAPKVQLRALDSEHVIAIDGLAIIVHPSNPVSALSRQTIARLFAGEIRNWSELGGPDAPVTVYARDDRSGTWDTFRHLVLGRSYRLSPKAHRYESNDALSDDVSRDPGGIGFVGLASVRNSKAVAVSDGDVLALYPNSLNVATEDYPLSRRLYFYTSGVSDKPLVREFLKFVQSPAGQKVVKQVGFVAQTPIEVSPRFDLSVPESFRKLTRNYRRLSVNFRFSEGRTRLDNKALRDLERVRDYMQRQGLEAGDLLLIGFADQQQDELRAQMISEVRALSVRKALRQLGIYVKAYTGYGHYMPVGAYGGSHGQRRNGRVEVWVRHRQEGSLH